MSSRAHDPQVSSEPGDMSEFYSGPFLSFVPLLNTPRGPPDPL